MMCAKTRLPPCAAACATPPPPDRGLHANWVGDSVLAMARPWQQNLDVHDVPGQFRAHGIGLVLNLQEVHVAGRMQLHAWGMQRMDHAHALPRPARRSAPLVQEWAHQARTRVRYAGPSAPSARHAAPGWRARRVRAWQPAMQRLHVPPGGAHAGRCRGCQPQLARHGCAHARSHAGHLPGAAPCSTMPYQGTRPHHASLGCMLLPLCSASFGTNAAALFGCWGAARM